MKVEVFALCDAAVDYAGKLSILGAFDGIYALKTPVIHPQCAIALRIRVTRADEGRHMMELGFIDADGHNVMPGMQGNFDVRMPPDRETLAINIVLNIQQLKFDRFDDYAVDLRIDGRPEVSLPLVVVQRPGPSESD